MITPDTPIERIPKVTRTIIAPLKRLGIHTVYDLLTYLPSRYEDFSQKKHIADVVSGDIVTVQGVIRTISRVHTKISGMALIHASISDHTGTIQAVWFNQPYLLRTLLVGNTVNLSGKAELRKAGMSLQNPSYEKISHQAVINFSMPLHTARLVPVYPETRGITSRWLRYIIWSCIHAREHMKDILPKEIRDEFGLLRIKDAVLFLHAPQNHDDISRATKRFEFEQLFIIQIYALRERIEIARNRAALIPADIQLIKQFVASLPFTLSDAQRRSCWEIIKDMEKPTPMNRLLEGDVGSGKTVVAAVALLLVARAGKRACLLVPTEILAKQHVQTLGALLKPFDVQVGMYTASEKKIPSHTSTFVGTHALLQKNIRISDLALVIIDEQHRFGVEQRAALLHHHRASGAHPHFLSMTATPIPRTLALTVYGDLDVSILDEMPKNRKSIITRVISPDARYDAYEFIREHIKKGQQMFVICPRIEIQNNTETQKIGKRVQASLMAAEIKSVVAEHEKLARIIFPDFHVEMLHGNMKPKDKARVMNDFRKGDIHILVSTSVIEVGVDVPNATIMIIEGAERFGLAQLHQFRGRVGRGDVQSYCFLFPSEQGMAANRLNALVEAKNGFELAEIDLQLRGPGEFLGTKQWGISSLGMKALANPHLVREVRKAAQEIFKKDPNLTNNFLIKDKINAMARIVHNE